ncbi:SSI family serine proteinase inhibitor [Herbidospora daliensis]|uniref:SSI family serine proteinase inhibitor n=1 Tax=Herbidospora daliensis TaxID=295585 RepID=UPI000784799C|nr:SSI family serine proteinase inhibitor [Herbidospora daliensis]
MRTLVVAALVAVPLFAAHPAVAEAPSGALVLTRSVNGGQKVVAKLLCDPDGGSHPAAKQACDLLRSVDGDLAKLAYDPGRICTKEYFPHQVTAAGTWKGQAVRYARTFGNRCEMSAVTGDLFTF